MYMHVKSDLKCCETFCPFGIKSPLSHDVKENSEGRAVRTVSVSEDEPHQFMQLTS